MTDRIELIRSAALADAPYAYAAVPPPGARLVALAGSCPLAPDGSTVGVGDHRAQASACLDNLGTVLERLGLGLTDVLSTRVLVASADAADLVAVWDVVAERFGAHDVPSTLLGVTVLGYPDQLVEIEATAVLSGDVPADPDA